MKSATLFQDLIYDDTKPKLSVLFETDYNKEIRILMQKGTHLKKHKTSFPITVHVIKGSIDFGVNQETIHLVKGDLIALDSNVPHDLKANKNSIIRLTMFKTEID